MQQIVTRYEQLIASDSGRAYVIKAQNRIWGSDFQYCVQFTHTISGRIVGIDVVQRCLEKKHFKR